MFTVIFFLYIITYYFILIKTNEYSIVCPIIVFFLRFFCPDIIYRVSPDLLSSIYHICMNIVS